MTPLSANTTEVGSLIDQLQNATTIARQSQYEVNPLKREEVERFVVEKAGVLIHESLEVIKNLKDVVSAAPNPNDVEALAGLISATSAAIETLNKQVIVDRKIDAMMKGKEIDAKNKRASLIDETNARLAITREEMVKQLAESAVKRVNSAVEVEAIVEPVSRPASTSCSPDCKSTTS